MERALFILFLILGVINGEKSPNKKNETCVHGRPLFLPYLFWIKLWHQFSKQSTFETQSSPLASMVVLNKGIRSKLFSRVFLLFHINVKVRRSPRNEVALGLNWTKESCNKACVQINSALIVFTPWFDITIFRAIIQ